MRHFIFGSHTIPSALPSSVMESPRPSSSPPQIPLLSLPSLIHQHCLRLSADLATRLDDTKRKLWPPPSHRRSHHLDSTASSPASSITLPFASLSHQSGSDKKRAGDVTLSTDAVAKTLVGTALYTVSNSSNEFVLISDPNGVKSIGLLCFRKEDAEAFLAQVRSRRKELPTPAKVVPIKLDQVYTLKVEGIAFRFLPDPIQVKNAIELKALESKVWFDGVPVFQSDLLVVKMEKKRYCPIYFRKEDLEKDLSKVSRSSKRSGFSQHIMVGSMEDVLKKMETSEKKSAWGDLIFIPPGKTHSQHIEDVVKA